MKTVKTKRNTAEGRVASAISHNTEYPIPNGAKTLIGIDRKRWKSYCLARDSWTDTELLMLYEAVVCHRELDEGRAACDGAPIMVEKTNGDMMPNPVFHETRQREKSLQTWLRQIGLQTTPERANSTNGGGKASSPIKEELPDNVSSLIG